MAKFERLEPRADDMPAFDGGIDDEDAEEGSRLPLLIVIALLVLFLFAGVVYLAYTQGVERGRSDAPRVIVSQGGSVPAQLKVYQQPAPADDASAEGDSVPAPPTPLKAQPTAPTFPQPSAAVPTAPSPPAAKPVETAQMPASVETRIAPPSMSHATAVPKQSAPAPIAASSVARVATHAPAQLAASPHPETETRAPETTATSTAAPVSSSAPASEKPKPVAGGYLLQIGSYKSEDEANAAWRTFQSAHAIAGGYESNIKQVDLGEKGTWYRLRIGSFADKDAATEFCAKLKADGANCLLAR